MATTLHSPPLNYPQPHRHPVLRPTPRAATSIRCGPRSNRGPLVKGRVLSTEAILAVQSLKRADNSNRMDPTNFTKTLSRLVKADLIAALRELLRQNQCTLAVKVVSIVQSEPWYNSPDLSLYSDLVLALGRNDMWDDVDRLIEELEMEGGVIGWGDKKGLSRLIRALIGGDRKESTVRIYRVMKRSGWGVGGSSVEVDEYVAKVLSKGFKRFGEFGLAKEVDLALEGYLNGCSGRLVSRDLQQQPSSIWNGRS